MRQTQFLAGERTSNLCLRNIQICSGYVILSNNHSFGSDHFLSISSWFCLTKKMYKNKKSAFLPPSPQGFTLVYCTVFLQLFILSSSPPFSLFPQLLCFFSSVILSVTKTKGSLVLQRHTAPIKKMKEPWDLQRTACLTGICRDSRREESVDGGESRRKNIKMQPTSKSMRASICDGVISHFQELSISLLLLVRPFVRGDFGTELKMLSQHEWVTSKRCWMGLRSGLHSFKLNLEIVL